MALTGPSIYYFDHTAGRLVLETGPPVLICIYMQESDNGLDLNYFARGHSTAPLERFEPAIKSSTLYQLS